jgi:hypothetical protein
MDMDTAGASSPPLQSAHWAAITDDVFSPLVENTMSLDALQRLTGFDDLADADKLTLQDINTLVTPIDHVGSLLPNLTQLRLSASTLPSFRDLGTRLVNLRVLWLSRCGVSDLSGVFGLPMLEELYLSFNSIQTLDDVAMHDSLQILDLEANKVSSWDELSHLATIPSLTALTLSGNPIAEEGSEDEYRGRVSEIMASLEVLDDEELDSNTSFCATPTKSTAKPQEDVLFFKHPDLAAERNNVYEATRLSKTPVAKQQQQQQQQPSNHSSTYTPPRPATARPYRPSSREREVEENSKKDYQTELFELLNLSQYSPAMRTHKNMTTAGASSASDLTTGSGVVFAGSPAGSLRQFKEDDVGVASHLRSIARLNAVRSRDHAAGSNKNVEVQYEVAGNRTEFEEAMNDLKSWRLARANGGWCPDANTTTTTTLKIMDAGAKTSVMSPHPEYVVRRAGVASEPRIGARPGTAPMAFDAKAWAAAPPRMLGAAATTQEEEQQQQQQPPPFAFGTADGGDGDEQNGGDRDSLNTPSSKSDAGGLTPRNIFEDNGKNRIKSALREGEGQRMSDSELVSLLQKKPKLVAFLRTRSSFRKFFRGMPEERMRRLLVEAYSGLGEEECERRVEKRMKLMDPLDEDCSDLHV